MKVFITGGAGFVGSAVVARLVARGDEVIALARSEDEAAKLTRLGAASIRGDITETPVFGVVMPGCDVVFHVAGAHRIGVKEAERDAMFRTNVDGTMLVLDAALAARVPRIVHVSTVNVFGNTHGRVVDETYSRPDRDFLSYYDATKYMAYRVARARAAAGAPLVIVQPGAVYGPGDHSELGAQITQAARGKYRLRVFPELGLTMSYVDDVADGILMAAEKGLLGQAYVLGGETTRLGAVLDRVSDLAGHRRARVTVPTRLIRAAAPLGPVLGPVVGAGPNLHETIRASHGVTYWAASGKAERELAYRPRELEEGLRDLLASS